VYKGNRTRRGYLPPNEQKGPDVAFGTITSHPGVRGILLLLLERRLGGEAAKSQSRVNEPWGSILSFYGVEGKIKEEDWKN